MFRRRKKWKRTKGFVAFLEGKTFKVFVHFDRAFGKDISFSCSRVRQDEGKPVFPLRRREARELGWLLIRGFIRTTPHAIGARFGKILFWWWR